MWRSGFTLLGTCANSLALRYLLSPRRVRGFFYGGNPPIAARRAPTPPPTILRPVFVTQKFCLLLID